MILILIFILLAFMALAIFLLMATGVLQLFFYGCVLLLVTAFHVGRFLFRLGRRTFVALRPTPRPLAPPPGYPSAYPYEEPGRQP